MQALGQSGQPLATKQFHAEVEGFKTDFLLAQYDDQILIMVSQLDTFGTILQARSERALEGESTFSVTTLLGRRDEPALTLCARGLVEHASSRGSLRPLLIFLGLKKHTLPVAKQVMKALIENAIW